MIKLVFYKDKIPYIKGVVEHDEALIVGHNEKLSKIILANFRTWNICDKTIATNRDFVASFFGHMVANGIIKAGDIEIVYSEDGLGIGHAEYDDDGFIIRGFPFDFFHGNAYDVNWSEYK